MLGVGAVVVGAAAGCERSPGPNEITAQALLPLARAARDDAAAARALAPQLTVYAAALGVVAEQRGQHAQALREEITRLDQDVAAQLDATDATTSGTASASGSASASETAGEGTNESASLESLTAALTTSARGARDAAISLSGYSAGLAGSVSAAVTTLVKVQLA